MSKRSFRLSDAKPNAKQDVDDELAFHLEMRVRELMDQGLTADEARRQALASFGDVQAIRSELRAERAARNEERTRRDWWGGLRMDAAYAVRSLRSNPAFTAAAVATLALGIGAATAVFTVVSGVLLRPMPYQEASRIAQIWMIDPQGGFDAPLSSGHYRDLAQDAKSFAALAAFRARKYSLVGSNGENESVAGARVTPALFDVLGVRPLIGQVFGPEAGVPGGPASAVISHALWQRRFGGERSVIGRPINLSGFTFTVVAVMPPGFAFPRGAELPAPLQFGARTDVWTPMVFDPAGARNYGAQNITVIGKPAAGVTLAAAEAEANGILKRFLAQNAPNLKLGYHLVPLQEQASRPVRPTLLIMMGAVLLLLLIACANVTSLLVARARGRQRELAVRAALGAGRARIARQLMTENVILAGGGAVLAVAIAYWGTKAMLSLVPGSMPRADDIGLDWRVLSFTGLVALAAGALFGIASAYAVTWKRLAAELQSAGTRATTDRARRLGRQMLVTVEVALSLMLLIGAALLTRSFLRLQDIDPGFQPDNVLTAEVGLPVTGTPVAEGPKWAATLDELTARLNRSPGIVSAGAVTSLPLSGNVEGGGLQIPSRPPDPPGQGPHAQTSVVSGAYFKTVGIKLIAGRFFDSSDDAPGAGSIVVNREFVRKYLTTDVAAVGQTLVPTFGFTAGKEHRIVGVVDNVKQTSLDEEPTPQVYVPESQISSPQLTVVMRTAGDPSAALPALRRELKALSPSATVNHVSTFHDVVENSLARQRFSMTLIGVFAACALALALVGLYGVIALLVAQRNREIGVRLALGAAPGDVVRMMTFEGSRLAVIGVIVGVVGALALTRVLAAMLYNVSTTDPLTFAGAALLILVVSTAAAFLPARRVARVDPTVTLRAD